MYVLNLWTFGIFCFNNSLFSKLSTQNEALETFYRNNNTLETIDDSAMPISEIWSLWVKTAFAFPFGQLHVSMTENCLAFLFAQCARTSSLHWSTVINLLVHYFGVLCNSRFRHSIITDNYLLWQTQVYLQNEWLEMAAAKWM